MKKRVMVIGSEGYIGSALCESLSGKYLLSRIDTGWFSECYVNGGDYNDIDPEVFKNFYAVILLAGHSSVKMCELDPAGAWENNVENFRRLLNKMPKGSNLIYASSGLVYNNSSNDNPSELDFVTPASIYDATMLTRDNLAAVHPHVKTVGLRFGTVCGRSPNQRVDTLLNSMVLSALVNGRVCWNEENPLRPVLSLKDLCKSIDFILDGLEDLKEHTVYNLKTASARLHDWAFEVSNSYRGTTMSSFKSFDPTFSFDMDCSKFDSDFSKFDSDNYLFDWSTPEELIDECHMVVVDSMIKAGPHNRHRRNCNINYLGA